MDTIILIDLQDRKAVKDFLHEGFGDVQLKNGREAGCETCEWEPNTERFRITLFIRTKHNMRIFGVIPFIHLQNDS